jgi:hypothetical protein
MKASLAVVMFGLGLLLPVTPASAHHSVAGDYFMDQRATVEGEVAQFLYRNPHSFLQVTSKDPRTGESITWNVEWNGAGRLVREGVQADTLKPGDHVIVTGQPGRTGADHRMHMVNITRPSDGWKWNRGVRY